jgi:hypothetical protein
VIQIFNYQKYLAESVQPTQDRVAMDTSPRLLNRGRALVGAFVATAFLWTLALSVSPQLHERVHSDANRAEHTCAVTFIASGSYNYSGHVPLVSAPVPAVQFSKIPALNPLWVPSLFLRARIFEHAPPARS